MDKYIGTKLIEAEPAFRVSNEGEAPKIVTDFGEAKDYQMVDMGYRVRYADGYESWSPADVFERAYLKMTVNPNLKTDKPSISQEMVDDFIVAAFATTLGDKCTVVRAILANGFEIVESSACVSTENYDKKRGADICMKKIKDKVWFLLGFLLQTAVHGVDGTGAEGSRNYEGDADRDPQLGECGDPGLTEPEAVSACMSFGRAIEVLKQGMKVARDGWNGKHQYIELASAISYMGPDGNVVNAEHDAIGNKAIAFCGTTGIQMGWLASQADMLAEDWMIVG